MRTVHSRCWPGLIALLALGVQTADAAYIHEGRMRTISTFPASENFNTEQQYRDDLVWDDDGTSIWSHDPAGGWQGSGCAKFNFVPGTNERFSGLMGWLFPTNPANRIRRYNIRWLIYLGPDFSAAQAEGAKWFIGLRCNADCTEQGASGNRSQVIERFVSGSERWPAVCDNICCGEDYPDCRLNEGQQESGFPIFNTADYLEQWVSLEAEYDLDAGRYRLYIDTQDGVFSSNGGATPYNQLNSVIDDSYWWFAAQKLMAYWEARAASGWSQAAAYYKIDEVVIDTRYIGPPAGFGGVSSNCGDGVVEGVEQCDGANLAGQSCSSLGYAGGALQCAGNCTFDTSQCSNCGNGVIDSGEQCDGANLAGQTCESLGFPGGTLQCGADCQLDSSGCQPAVLPDNTTNLRRDDLIGGLFFEEDFEAGIASAFNSSWYGSFVNNTQYSVVSDVVGGGLYGARHHYPLNGSGQYITQHFGDSIAGPVWPEGAGLHYDDLYVQYRVRYAAGYDFSARANKQFIIGTQDDRQHANVCCNPWVSHYITIYSGTEGAFLVEGNNKRVQGNQWFDLSPNMNGYNSSNLYSMQLDRWYTVEVRRKLNDEGQANGIFQMWIDGQQVADYAGLEYRLPWDGTYGANFSYGTNFIMLSNYITDPAPQAQDVYYDEIKMSTMFIPFD